MSIVKTGITVNRNNAWEFFNFLDKTIKKGVVLSFHAKPGVMDYFSNHCMKRRFDRLGEVMRYKSGLVHIFAK